MSLILNPILMKKLLIFSLTLASSFALLSGCGDKEDLGANIFMKEKVETKEKVEPTDTTTPAILDAEPLIIYDDINTDVQVDIQN